MPDECLQSILHTFCKLIIPEDILALFGMNNVIS